MNGLDQRLEMLVSGIEQLAELNRQQTQAQTQRHDEFMSELRELRAITEQQAETAQQQAQTAQQQADAVRQQADTIRNLIDEIAGDHDE